MSLLEEIFNFKSAIAKVTGNVSDIEILLPENIWNHLYTETHKLTLYVSSRPMWDCNEIEFNTTCGKVKCKRIMEKE